MLPPSQPLGLLVSSHHPPPPRPGHLRRQDARHDGLVLEEVDRARAIRDARRGREGKGVFDDASLEVRELGQPVSREGRGGGEVVFVGGGGRSSDEVRLFAPLTRLRRLGVFVRAFALLPGAVGASGGGESQGRNVVAADDAAAGAGRVQEEAGDVLEAGLGRVEGEEVLAREDGHEGVGAGGGDHFLQRLGAPRRCVHGEDAGARDRAAAASGRFGGLGEQRCQVGRFVAGRRAPVEEVAGPVLVAEEEVGREARRLVLQDDLAAAVGGGGGEVDAGGDGDEVRDVRVDAQPGVIRGEQLGQGGDLAVRGEGGLQLRRQVGPHVVDAHPARVDGGDAIRGVLLAAHGILQLGDGGASAADARLGELPAQTGLVALDGLAQRMGGRGGDAVLCEQVVMDQQEGEMRSELEELLGQSAGC